MWSQTLVALRESGPSLSSGWFLTEWLMLIQKAAVSLGNSDGQRDIYLLALLILAANLEIFRSLQMENDS